MRRTAIVLSGLLVSFAFASLFPSRAAAQSAPPWSGIIASSRAIDWSQAGVPGGIPVRTTICATISPEGSSASPASPSNINSAIASCAKSGGGVVYLAAGTYYLSGGIDFGGNSGVTVRGAGADQTLLHFTGYSACNGLGADACVAGSNSGVGSEQNVCDWTGGYAPGSTQITLANCGTTTPAMGSLSNLKVGSVLELDQLDEATDTGGIWNCVVNGSCSNGGQGGDARTDGTCGGGMCTRSQQQQVVVTAINGNTVTISPGIYMPNWRASQLPQAFFANSYVSADGFEDFSVDNTGSGAGHNFIIMNCDGCWISGVRSLYAARSHAQLMGDSHSVVADSYFFQNLSHASVSYGVELTSTSDSLIENNIFDQVTDSTPSCTGGCEGNVVAFNLGQSTNYSSPGWMQASFYLHSSGDAMNLWEGNAGVGFNGDDVHGTHFFETLFRNRLIGWQQSCDGTACSAQTNAIQIYAGSRFFNIIGNVLGEPGFHTKYETDGAASNVSGGPQSIYVLGATGNGGLVDTSITGFATYGDYDPLTWTTLFRWGNYDVVSGSAQWNVAEVPSALSGAILGSFANPVPASKALPASFFLSSMPAFWITPWGTPPWPAIGPDVTGGNGPAGFSYDIPAQLCYKNTAADTAYGSSGVLLFNAGKCYGQPPAPPSNLSATVQ